MVYKGNHIVGMKWNCSDEMLLYCSCEYLWLNSALTTWMLNTSQVSMNQIKCESYFEIINKLIIVSDISSLWLLKICQLFVNSNVFTHTTV